MKIARVIFIVVLGSGFAIAASGEGQTRFSAEDTEMKNPVPIPTAVLQLLTKDRIVGKALADEQILSEQVPVAWFSAAIVRPNKSLHDDILVMGRGPLASSNVVNFWIFEPSETGYALILNAAGHDLHLMTKRSKGYREIELMTVTLQLPSRTRYRFDGSRYKKSGSRMDRQ